MQWLGVKDRQRTKGLTLAKIEQGQRRIASYESTRPTGMTLLDCDCERDEESAAANHVTEIRRGVRRTGADWLRASPSTRATRGRACRARRLRGWWGRDRHSTLSGEAMRPCRGAWVEALRGHSIPWNAWGRKSVRRVGARPNTCGLCDTSSSSRSLACGKLGGRRGCALSARGESRAHSVIVESNRCM